MPPGNGYPPPQPNRHGQLPASVATLALVAAAACSRPMVPAAPSEPSRSRSTEHALANSVDIPAPAPAETVEPASYSHTAAASHCDGEDTNAPCDDGMDHHELNAFGLKCFEKPARDVAPCSGEPESDPLEYLYGCTDESDEEVIPFIHRHPIQFTRSGFAVVQQRFCGTQGGWYYVDAKYEQKFEAVTVEAAPDSQALADPSGASTKFLDVVRFKEDGKIGYLDLRNGAVVSPRFDSAFMFSNGTALVCEGCHPERWAQCAPPEAHCTGEAYLIDEKGQRLGQTPEKYHHEYWWCRRNPGKPYTPPHDTACD